MVRADDIHSRAVSWLKVILPLLALGILSTLFLLSESVDPEKAIPYADVDVETLLREQRVGAPNYAGVTRDGAAIEMRAEEARPEPGQPTRMTADRITAFIDLATGGRVDIDAEAGLIDSARQIAELTGGVTIATEDGWRMRTPRLDAALDRTEVVAPEPVAAAGPLGTLDAGSMIARQEEGDPGLLLSFQGGVKLVYDPDQQEAHE